MSKAARDFITDWANENVNAEAYQGDDRSGAQALAEQCRAEAKADGISDRELDAAVIDLIGGGSLIAYMSDRMEEATDAEVRRLADKDD